MSDDASLTAFGTDGVGDGSDAGGNDGDGGERDARGDEGEKGDGDDAGSVEGPTYTYTSTPDGAECAACGAVVEERWRAGEGGTSEQPDLPPDALVCPDCKAW